MNTKMLLTGTVATTVLAVASANGAPISWTVSTITNTETDVSNTGSTIIAASGADGGTNVNLVDNVTVATLNGVAFTDAFTLDSPSNLDTLNTRANASGQYYEMLRFADRQGSGIATWTFNGLTVGQTYLFQVWYSDDVSVVNRAGLVMGASSYASSPVTPVLNDSGTALLLSEIGSEGGPGQFATGTFVADSTTQILIGRAYTNLDGTPATTGNVTINAYQLRLVPEPASLALLGLGGMLVARRRRA